MRPTTEFSFEEKKKPARPKVSVQMSTSLIGQNTATAIKPRRPPPIASMIMQANPAMLTPTMSPNTQAINGRGWENVELSTPVNTTRKTSVDTTAFDSLVTFQQCATTKQR
jgi:hypothetical protein